MPHLSMNRRAVVPMARRLAVTTTAIALVLGTFFYTPALAQQEQPQPAVQVAPQITAAQIDQLVAPIALHPDNLLGQILSASTYPLEIVMAARWSAANQKLSGQRLEDAMQSQPWDPSVKALTTVPQVLKMMSEKLEWTQQLGEAYLSQPDDIAASVQRLRARADASGNLKNSEQVRVRRLPAERQVEGIGREYIVIEPTYPEVVYVPVYDPFVVYGVWAYPAYPPFYWYPPGYVGLGIYGFGPAFYVGPALWVTYNWGVGRVFINPVMYSSFNRVSIAHANALAVAPVKFDPAHRGLVGFKNQALKTQFAKTTTGSTLPTTLSKTTSTGAGQNFLSSGGNKPNLGTQTGSTGTKFSNTNAINANNTNNQSRLGNTIVGNSSGSSNNNKPARTITSNASASNINRSFNSANAGSFKPTGGGFTGGTNRTSVASQGARKGH